MLYISFSNCYNFYFDSFSITSDNHSPNTVPYVNMVIRDKGVRLDTSALVHPGSLLDLLIYLDKYSSGNDTFLEKYVFSDLFTVCYQYHFLYQ